MTEFSLSLLSGVTDQSPRSLLTICTERYHHPQYPRRWFGKITRLRSAMIFHVTWILIILSLQGSSRMISTSNGSTAAGSAIMKNLKNLVASNGKWCPKKLAKLCHREPNLTDVLQEAVTLAVQHCHEQFRYTRWNCTLNKRLFDEVSREASVVTAIFAASLSHAFARSCVGRKFAKCNQTSQQHFVWPERRIQLRAPSDDVRFGRRMTKRILIGTTRKRAGKKLSNFADGVSIHNVEAGLRTVQQTAAKTEETCICQDYSPNSCTVKICRKSLAGFEEVAKVLRSRYTEAKMVREADAEEAGIFGCPRLSREERNRFYYTAPSPNFCKDTHGRECRDEMNCSVLCCARGFRTREIKKTRKCRCVMTSGRCCDVKCQACHGRQKIYICK